MITIENDLVLLRDLASRAIEAVEDPIHLKKEFGYLLQEGYPRELQLPYAYLALLAHLLQLGPIPLHPEQLPNGAAYLDALGMTSGNQIPEPTQLAELGALWMILGVCQKIEPLIYAGLKVAYWQSHMLDHAGLPHFSLWSLAPRYQASHLAAFNYLLFTLAYRITSGQGFLQAAQIQKLHGWDPTSLAGKLLSLIPDKLEISVQLPFRPLTEEITLGMLKFTTPQWSMVCGLGGWNSGVFSYHKGSAALLNAGPQIEPLDALEGFGVERGGGPFHEVLWEKTAHHFRLKGWTKIFALPTWMMMDAHFEAQKLTLSCLLQEGKPHNRLFFVFYASCDHLSIPGKIPLQAGGLQGYQGKSLPIQIEAENQTIFIEPETECEMQIIPLAGGSHFLGAQFLIAYAFSNDNKFLQFLIK